MKLKIFDKYIFELVLAATFFGFIMFVVIWISPEIMFKIIKKVVEGYYTPYTGLKLFLLEIPDIVCKIAPMSLLFATLLTVDNLSKNFELVIFRSIGISFFRLINPVIVISLSVGLLCMFASSYVVPFSMKKIETIKNNYDNEYKQFTYLERDKEGVPKQLIILTVDNQKDKIYGINSFQITATEDISDKNSSSLKKIILSTQGYFSDNALYSKNAVIYEISPSGIYKNKAARMEKYPVLTGVSAKNAKKLLYMMDVKTESLYHNELIEYIKLLKYEQISDQYNVSLNVLFKRFTQVLGCVIFAICGVVLGWSRPRENRFLGFTIGALIMLIYYITIPFINVLAEKSILHPAFTSTLPLFIVAVGTFFYAKYKQV